MKKNALIKKLKHNFARQSGRARSAFIIMAVVTVGVSLLIFTKAATPTASFEVENGTKTPKIVDVPTTSASGSKAIQFSKGPSVTTNKFSVVGRQIVDPQGNIFRPMGANVAINDNGYIFGFFGGVNGRVADVQAWGWNTLRVNIGCLANAGIPMDRILASLDNVVHDYTAQKIVILIDCHDGSFTGQNPAPSGANVQQAAAFYATVAQKYKDNPYVWYNGINEPQSSGDINAWVAIQNVFYNTVRTNAPNGVIVGDIPGWGQAIESVADNNLAGIFGNGKCNFVYSWHAYGVVSGQLDLNTARTLNTQYVGKLANMNTAVIIGEMGVPWNNGTAVSRDLNVIGANAAMDVAYPAGFGSLWWHATGDDNNRIDYSLTFADATHKGTDPLKVKSNDLSALTSYGRKFWDLSHQTPVRFTGNLTDYNTACK